MRFEQLRDNLNHFIKYKMRRVKFLKVKLSIKMKLMIVLSSLLAVFVIFGSYSINEMNKLYKQTNSISQALLSKINKVNTITNNVFSLRSKESELIVENFLEEKQRIKNELSDTFTELDIAITDYLNLSNKNQEDEFVKQLKESIQLYKETSEQIIRFSDNNQINEAVNLSKGKSKLYYRSLMQLTEDLKKKNVDEIALTNQEGSRIYKRLVFTFLIVIALVILFTIVMSVWLILAITVPIRDIGEKFQKLSESGGDLTQDIPIQSKDEIGGLSSSINKFIENIRSILLEINRSSNDTLTSTSNTSLFISDLKDNIKETNTALIEISSGITDTSATAQQVTAASNSMEELVIEMEQKGYSGAKKASEIALKAKELQEKAKKSNEEIVSIFDKSKVELEKALIKSKAVNDINSFSEIIFQIAQQINLLSLNASIEAARVGEKGRGFTVVADEIRKLAESSRSTVQDIKNTTEYVIDAVKNLSSNSQGILKFIDSTVLNDYKDMQTIGEQYNLDSEYLNILMNDICSITEKLSKVVTEIIKSMNDVAITVSDQANGVYQIEDKSKKIAEEIVLIQKQINDSEQNAVALKALISKFKI